MKKTNLLRIFLASPSDVTQERNEIFSLKDQLNEVIGKNNDIIYLDI